MRLSRVFFFLTSTSLSAKSQHDFKSEIVSTLNSQIVAETDWAIQQRKHLNVFYPMAGVALHQKQSVYFCISLIAYENTKKNLFVEPVITSSN